LTGRATADGDEAHSRSARVVSIERLRADSPTTELIEAAASLSRRFGADPQFSRAGGGNSSAKSDDILYIKPSGVSLASITAESLMPLALAPLLDMVEDPAGATAPGSEAVMRIAMAARLRPEGDRRPSVECVFHALIPRRFVIHTHPTLVNALTCARDGAAVTLELFGDDAVWVPYVDPGLPLAREIARRRWDHATRTGAAAPDVMLLQNHGLIVAGDDPAAIVEQSSEVIEAVRRHLDGQPSTPEALPPPDPDVVERVAQVLGARFATEAAPLAVVFDGSPDAAWLAGTSEGHELVRGGPLLPDQIVYAGSWPLWLDADAADGARLEPRIATAISERAATTVEPPVIVVAARIGVFALGVGQRQAETAREIYLDATRVGRQALRLGGVRPLAPAERRFIEEWEAEAYRRGIGSPDGADRGSTVP
jgi:rhamnulokinase